MRAIDLNADLGETVEGMPTADDEAMFAVISSASVACGGHAGDAGSMRDAIARAGRFGVAVGAHPSYPDRAGFGRLRIAVEPADLAESLAVQLEALVGAGGDLRYVKPHGALYHAVTTDPAEAGVVVRVVADLSARLGRPVPILGSGGAIARAAAGAGVPFVREAFLDRGYRPDGSLVARGAPGALLTDPVAVAERAVRVVLEGVVDTIDGTEVDVDAESLCLHGDSPESVAMARTVRAALDVHRIAVRPPW